MNKVFKYPTPKTNALSQAINQFNEKVPDEYKVELFVEIDPQKLGSYEYNESDYAEILELTCTNSDCNSLIDSKWDEILTCFDEPQAIYNNKYLNLGDDRFSQGREYASSGVLTETSTKNIYKNIYSILKLVQRDINTKNHPIKGIIIHEMDEHFCSPRLQMRGYLNGACIPKQCTDKLINIVKNDQNKINPLIISYGGYDAAMNAFTPKRPSAEGVIETLDFGEMVPSKRPWSKSNNPELDESNCEVVTTLESASEKNFTLLMPLSSSKTLFQKRQLSMSPIYMRGLVI